MSSALLFISWIKTDKNWLNEKHKGYTLIYTYFDKTNIKEYNKLVKNGINAVKIFFNASYNKEFNVFIHPNRHSLDSTWQMD